MPVAQFCKTGTGTTPLRAEGARFYGGSIPWVKSGELAQGIVRSTEETLTSEAVETVNIRLIEPGALLVALYGATVGQVAELGIRATTNQAVCHVIPDPKIADRRYMYYALRRQAPIWIRQRVGGAQPNISQGIVKQTQIPLPPLPEQRRIASILDQADGIRRRREEGLRLTDELLRSTFLDMFGDPAANPKGWPIRAMGDVVRETQYGTSEKSNTERVGMPVLRMNNITYGGEIDLTDIKWSEVNDADIEKLTVKRGDLLFNRTNSPELVGKAAVWDRDEHYAYAGYLFRVRFDGSLVLPDYVSAFLNSAYGKRMLFARAKPSNNMSNFSAAEFRRIGLPVPGIVLQRRFAATVAQNCTLKATRQSGLNHVADLYDSLVQRAFRGKL